MNKTSVSGIRSIVQMRSRKGPDRGAVFVEWDLLFKDIEATKKKDLVVKTLLEHIKNSNRASDGFTALSLKFQCFKCESNELLYILRVYKPTRPVMQASFTQVLRTTSVTLEGPIRPGPPMQTPPGIQAVTNAVDFPEE